MEDESIKYWEEMHKKWMNNPQWRMSAPHYGEIVAEIILKKLKAPSNT